MTTAEQKRQAKQFAKNWKGRGYEKGDTQQFWLQLLDVIGYENKDAVLFEKRVGSGGFIDVWIREANVMIEQKSLEIDLDKPEPRQGELKTPLKQVLDYAENVPLGEQPTFVMTCNFGTFRVYDRSKWGRADLEGNYFEFNLEEFAEHPEYLGFIVDPANSRLEKEKEVSIKAGELIGKLYDKLREGYIDPDSEESMHALNVLCVRLVFCLYCEDADLFEKDSFLHYLKGVAPEDVRLKLKTLFRALDTDRPDRDPYDTSIKGFPYVNGGLFKEEIEIPNFTQETLDFLLNEVSAPVDWSRISPTIFGGIFESTLNPETRRSGGMHYTSPENIHKVIDPLFLDDLKEEFRAIRDAEDLTPRQKQNRYKKFHQKLCNLTFFDPACGSGNFLTETYLCLRKLEDSVLSETKKAGIVGQMEMTGIQDEEEGKRLSLTQFHGIEINDFAVSVAETALYISRLKANNDTMMLLDLDSGDLPLRESAHIVLGNALRMDWNEVVSAEECDFIMGNPPFIGYKYQSDDQKSDLRPLFGNVKNIDYVSGWFAKAAKYMGRQMIRTAFVSTNSICQGEQVASVWKTLIGSGVEIIFAHRPFVWNNEAKDQAHVHCVIIGFSVFKLGKPKVLYGESKENVDRINPYLVDAPDVLIERRSKPLSYCEIMETGSETRDGGFLLLDTNEYTEFLDSYPNDASLIRRYLTGQDYINDKYRYCFWFKNVDPQQYKDNTYIQNRLVKCKEFREKSKQQQAHAMAAYPELFVSERQPSSNFLLVPQASSGNRKYIPIGYMSPEVIVSNTCFTIDNASLYTFGVLSSGFHMAWVRTVAGRLKSDYRYSNAIVYNNFIWPTPTEAQKAKVESCAQAVLDTRDNHAGDSLATLYDPDKMPDDLLAAHKALDKAVEEAYGVDFNGDEEKIVAHLFKLYEEATRNESQKNESPKAKKAKTDNKTEVHPEESKPKKVKVKVAKKPVTKTE